MFFFNNNLNDTSNALIAHGLRKTSHVFNKDKQTHLYYTQFPVFPNENKKENTELKS